MASSGGILTSLGARRAGALQAHLVGVPGRRYRLRDLRRAGLREARASRSLVLAMFFAASILVDGVFQRHRVPSQHREKDGWWIMLLMGILGVVGRRLRAR